MSGRGVDCTMSDPEACEAPGPGLLGEPGFTNLCWEPASGFCPGVPPDPSDPFRQQGYDGVGFHVISDDATLEDFLTLCAVFVGGETVGPGNVDFTTNVLVLQGYPTDPVDCGGAARTGWIADDGGSFATAMAFGPADCDAILFPAPTILAGALVESPPLPIGPNQVYCPLW